VASIAAVVGTAPLSALHFQQVSLIGVLANPFVIPLFGSVVVVLGLLGAVLEPVSSGAAALCFRLTGEALRPGLHLVDLLARPGWAALATPTPSALELVLLYAGLAALAMPAGSLRRLVAACAVAGLIADTAWWMRVRWSPGVLRVTFLDVGQGDAAVVELPDGRVLVVDAGGFPGSDFDTGSAVVAPFLATRKVAGLAAVVMTHAHPDHAGGLASLVRRYEPREFWWTGVPGRGAAWDDLVRALGAGVTARRTLRSDAPAVAWAPGVRVLHPPRRWPSDDLNDGSLTLRVTHGAVSVLLTGDVEALAESRMLRGAGPLDAVVLKVAHHGSRTSSTAPFVAAVAPAVAVISVGADNRYRLPAPEVERRLRDRGTCVLRTDRCGAVTMISDGTGVDVETARPGCACRRSARLPR
jgi:competence protein ComEC